MNRKQKLEDQIECLENSLSEKWDVLDPTTEEGWNSANNTDNCACCRMYRWVSGTALCSGCPIYEDTGKQHCCGTPLDSITLLSPYIDSEEEKIELFDRERQYLRYLIVKLENELKGLNDA